MVKIKKGVDNMKFYIKKTNNKLTRVFLKSMREWPPVLDYAMKVAKIQDMPNGSVKIICADAADLFKFLIPKGYLNVLIPVYRSNTDTWEFYDSNLEQIGKVVNQKRTIKVIGEYLMMDQDNWGTTQVVKDPVYLDTLEKVIEKWPEAIVSKHEGC